MATINFYLPSQEDVEVKIFDLLGVERSTLVHRVLDSGWYSLRISKAFLESGVYFYRIIAGKYASVEKIVIQ